ncbi:glycosyltransferase [Nonomuraea sp. NPDC050556]|uniref:glycosyltransferase n=1 Tax=Nonomuraea sp. NPDC050556 TaxID=3364369 RepID=UPI0037AF0A10
MARESKDLFLVCNTYETLGGVQTWVHYMARLFTQRGHRVHLIGVRHPKLMHDHGDAFPYETTVLHQRYPAGQWEPDGVLERLSRRERRLREERWKGVERLAAILEQGRPGGVVIVAEVWAMEWVRRALPAHLKVIGMVHESYDACRLAGRYERVMHHFADAHRFLALTREDADAFARDGMGNADFVPNPLHVVPNRYAELDEPVVVRLGRLDYDKGQDLLLDAWSKTRRGDWSLRVYGADKSGGREARWLRKLTAELGLTDSVDWRDPTSDLESALCGGSIFALTSREEGFPMVILEAMAYGVPCVAFDVAPGIRELITHDVDGLIVPHGDTVAFAEALGRLMGDAELRHKMGAAARESVQRFAPDLVADRWEELFTLLDR